MKKLLMVLSIASVAASCAVEKRQCDVSQLNGRWDIVSAGSIAEMQDEQKPFIEVNVNDLSFAGFATCNRIFGSVVTDSIVSDKVAFSVATTRMMCSDMSTETAIVEALSSVASFAISPEDSSRALFYDVQGKVVLTAIKGVESKEEKTVGLDGAWNIVSVDGVSTSTAETATTLTFSMETFTFYGNAGCNSIGGGFEMSDDSLSFSNVHVNSAMCSEESMAIESKILNVLNNTKVWTIENKELHLKSADGLSLAVLKREE